MEAAFMNIIRGVRNGAYYGTKIRAPHALVMVFLFKNGTIREKLRAVVKLTAEHSTNLALFVGIYKTLLVLLRENQKRVEGRAVIGSAGKPASPWHAAAAGAIGGYLVWGKYSNVNYQIVMYLISRVAISCIRLLAKKKYPPFVHYNFNQVYPIMATTVWAVVMYLYENQSDTLHITLRKSMDFLYHDSCSWENLQDFLPSPATAIIFLLTVFEV